VLIADEGNNRLLLVDPRGRIRWKFPRRGDLPRDHVFEQPDDAFVAPGGHAIIATQELHDTVSVINIATRHITRRYGHPGVPGSAPGYFSHPDDAMLLPGGDLLVADIMNCRILLLSPGRWHVRRQFGKTSSCGHTRSGGSGPAAHARSTTPRWRCRCPTGTSWSTMTTTTASSSSTAGRSGSSGSTATAESPAAPPVTSTTRTA